MQIKLTTEQKAELETCHRTERDKQVCDRIKAVLLRDEGWRIGRIAQALRLHNDTISRYIQDYLQTQKLAPHYPGSGEKLNDEQSQALTVHLEDKTYMTVAAICAYVKASYEVDYTLAGMTAWLKRHGFSYKQPKGVPAKADAAKQQAFVEAYEQLKETTPPGEPILFIDSVHPTLASKVAYGWIKRGQDKVLPTSSTRTRLNLSGAIELASMKTLVADYETINGEATCQFLQAVKAAYPKAERVHVILDQSGYHRSQEVADYAKDNGIILHFLPPYSPNLNPIERLWKVMNEQVRNNRYFESPKQFKASIMDFFTHTRVGH